MSAAFRSTIDAIYSEFDNGSPNQEKLAVLSRAMRWQPSFGADDLETLIELGEGVRGKSDPGCWDVERAVLEILCEHAQAAHLPFLLESFRVRGKHGDDRRRLALQGLSRIAAHGGSDAALQALELGLKHNKHDTRGWAIGFVASAYAYLQRPLPPTVTERLREMAVSDKSMDVRVEAVTALAEHGLAPRSFVDEVIAEAQSQEKHG